MADGTFGVKTGEVFIRDFDLGVVTSMGSVLNTAQDGYERAVPGITAPVPVVFMYPGQVFVEYLLPSIVIRRDDISFALQRWMPKQTVYRQPSQGATPLPVGDDTGFDSYDTKEMAYPADISYTISCFARYRDEANAILRAVLGVYKPYCDVSVVDSEAEIRKYLGTVTSVNGFDEVVSVADRQIGLTVSLIVQGELDLTSGITVESGIIASREVNVKDFDTLRSMP